MSISSIVNTLLPVQPDTKDPELFAQLVRVYNAINLLADAVASVSQLYAAANGSEAAPSYTFIADASTGAWIPGLGTYAISVGGVYGMRLDVNAVHIGKGSVPAIGNNQFSVTIGVNAGKNVTSGNSLAIGWSADQNTTTGTAVSIGFQAGPTGNFINTLSLGTDAHASADNEFQYGDVNVVAHRFTTGAMYFPGKVGINGKAPVANVAAPAAPGAAYGVAEQGLLNDIRTRLINFGIYT